MSPTFEIRVTPMRVDLDPASGGAGKSPKPESRFVILDFGTVDLAGPASAAAAITDIYGFVRDGRTVILTRESPLLAAALADVGLVAVTKPKATAASVDDAHVVFAGSVDIDGAVVVRPTPAKGPALRVALAGLGRIGEGAALRLAGENPDYELCGALVREPFKERAPLAVDQLTNDLSAFFATRPDVVIDALPDAAAGRALTRAALARGVSVVTANKQAIAGAVDDLTKRAAATGAALRYSASVGGGAPFIETVTRARQAGDVRSIEAVLNGTVNFILTALAEGEAFNDAVKAAQVAGFAEPDPSADLSGADARAKIAIISYAAYGEEIALDAIAVEALDGEKAARIASEGGCWKQLARLERSPGGALNASVRFERRDRDPLFAIAQFEANALRVTLEDCRTFECRGKGAGRKPTVESILGDLGSIRRERLSTLRAADAPVAAVAVSA
jgi:homoserine dehydrogenase